jgi:pilus assembly protein Flp/PilA
MSLRRHNVFKKLFKNRKGAALIEYGLLIAGVALISAAAVSVFGHKTSDLIATVAAIVPGAHTDDNGPIISGKLIETTPGVSGGSGIALDFSTIASEAGQARLGANLGAAPIGTGNENQLNLLVLEAK